MARPRAAWGRSGSLLLTAALVVPAAGLLAACTTAADLMSTVAAPAEKTADFGDQSQGVDVAASPDTAAKSAQLELTDAQRGYLKALSGAGVHPSSELRALSIGSYVCQARAAGQGDQAVWDYVAPMVRSDVADAHVSSQSPPDVQADTAVAAYMRIATEFLC
ncbi:MAG: DUF732 domain-containing protein [Mycobacterium sp.]|nr:DUF732 domain-containing protein [Mycobacterium sp.]